MPRLDSELPAPADGAPDDTARLAINKIGIGPLRTMLTKELSGHRVSVGWDRCDCWYGKARLRRAGRDASEFVWTLQSSVLLQQSVKKAAEKLRTRISVVLPDRASETMCSGMGSKATPNTMA